MKKPYFWGFLLLASVGLLWIIAITVGHRCQDQGCRRCNPPVSCCECPFDCCDCALDEGDGANTHIITFEIDLDMNDPENRQKLFQTTRLEFPDSVVWESAKFSQWGSNHTHPSFTFRGEAKMTREEFDKVFAGISFTDRNYGGASWRPEHYYQAYFDCPCNAQRFSVGYEPAFETNKEENPEALVDIFWEKIRVKRDSPFATPIEKERYEELRQRALQQIQQMQQR